MWRTPTLAYKLVVSIKRNYSLVTETYALGLLLAKSYAVEDANYTDGSWGQ